MKKRAIVLGNGLVGSVIALDVASDEKYDVTVCDANAETLNATRKKSGDKITVRSDVDFSSESSIISAVKGFDICFGAVPGFLGYKMLGTVIKAGVNISDISFMPEDFREHDAAAKRAGVVSYEDVGVAPGATNVMIKHGCNMLDEVEDVTYFVGGLPTKPEPPFNYKLVFSPDDVIEEYTRPARCKKNGKIISYEALSECKDYDLKMTGVKLPKMEGFLTDGCRTLLDTIPSPNVVEYTLRYPGTANNLAFLRSIGLFSNEPVKVGAAEIAPRAMFGRLAYPMMKLRDDEKDFTFFQVWVTGKKDGKKFRHISSLYDEKDVKSGYPSMSRTTGFTCAIVGRMIAEGMLTNPGVNPPEVIGDSPASVEYMINELKRRNVVITQTTEKL
ncbi:MAG: saccharopine dehydrogenase NADP-binding domain-containing protein [Synergistaceae bacterium]|jgi:saccharopine dehydrogenase-like NADP-dependent oxidoreductase|nr:saccharopine dehydrogenase NADP-binding domain-containing protein [Synergistaceae bacterium]